MEEHEMVKVMNHLRMASDAVRHAASCLEGVDPELAGEAREIRVLLNNLLTKVYDTER